MNDLEKIVKLKSLGKKIVFTNGCFDIIHPGHISYLKNAKEFGDILVIGLNSDSSVKKSKGDLRPIIPQKERMNVLLSLVFVDFVILFEEETPLNLIKAIKPDFLVKGGDWNIKNIVGADFTKSYGGKVKNIKFKKGYSTSLLIEKILELYGKSNREC